MDLPDELAGLDPDEVLAFLREHTGDDGAAETILCVSNLSRTAQAVELDFHDLRQLRLG